jgi:hypothetical protein
MNFLSFSPAKSQSWQSYTADLLFSVQSRKHLYDLVLRHYIGLSPSILDSFISDISSHGFTVSQLFLNSLNSASFYSSHISKFPGIAYHLHSIYTDAVADDVLFLSNKWLDIYHEKAVKWLTRVSLLEGFKFSRVPSFSRYNGYDLELKGLNVEFETGLKRNYPGLENRLLLSRVPAVIVVPNESQKKLYSSHFHYWLVDVISLAGYRKYLASQYV